MGDNLSENPSTATPSSTPASELEPISEVESEAGDPIYEAVLVTPNKLYRHIGIKLEILKERDDIVQIKLAKYQKTNEYMNMFIIVISSILSVYEAFRGKIDELVELKIPSIGINMVPIVLSGTITCIASIIKLKRYQEKSDNIHLTREKVSVARCKLKHIQEDLLFSKTEENFKKIKKSYFSNAYDFYCEAQSYLDKYIKSKDYVRYGGIIQEYSKCCCYTKYVRHKKKHKKDKSKDKDKDKDKAKVDIEKGKQIPLKKQKSVEEENKELVKAVISDKKRSELNLDEIIRL
jgi:hypothetical protein